MRRGVFITLSIVIFAVSTACWLKHESVQFTFDNRTDSLLCYHLSEESASFGGCGQKIQPMATTAWEPGCGYGAGAENLSLTVILRVEEEGRRIYNRTAECRVWQDSDRTFVIEQEADEFIVTDSLPEGLELERRLHEASLRDPAMAEGLRRYAAGDRPPPPRPPA